MNLYHWLLFIVFFYIGWRLGRNRAIAQLIEVANSIKNEAGADTNLDHRLGSIDASLRYLEVVGKL